MNQIITSTLLVFWFTLLASAFTSFYSCKSIKQTTEKPISKSDTISITIQDCTDFRDAFPIIYKPAVNLDRKIESESIREYHLETSSGFTTTHSNVVFEFDPRCLVGMELKSILAKEHWNSYYKEFIATDSTFSQQEKTWVVSIVSTSGQKAIGLVFRDGKVIRASYPSSVIQK